jgi:hypothetical protein
MASKIRDTKVSEKEIEFTSTPKQAPSTFQTSEDYGVKIVTVSYHRFRFIYSEYGSNVIIDGSLPQLKQEHFQLTVPPETIFPISGSSPSSPLFHAFSPGPSEEDG